MLIEEALGFQGLEFDLIIKRDGQQMLQAIDEMDAGNAPCPDLMLLDLNLPKHSGLVLLDRIRRSRICGSIPVIIVTSSNSQGDRDMARQLGATAYFCKPSDYDEFMTLGDLVRDVLRTPTEQ